MRGAKRGFTLAEVAVTIVIVGIGMLLVLQGLNTAKMAAVQTKNLKLARELALLTLGQISSGLFQEDIQRGIHGSYAQEGYPEFTFDVVVGDETLPATDGRTENAFDSWRKTDAQLDKEKDRETKDPKEVEDQPYEKVKIRVTFPQILVEKEQLKHELDLEEWIPWKQVYGTKEEEEGSGTPGNQPAGSQGTQGTPTGGTKP